MRKKGFLLLIIIVIAVMGIFAQEGTLQSNGTPGLSYTLLPGTTAYSVSGGSVATGAVVIPSVYNGVPVTTIASHAFLNRTGITNVTIPDSVTSIGALAFSGCSSLTNVTIGNGVTIIDDQAFANCPGLTRITIPASVNSIGQNTFTNTPLASVSFLGTVAVFRNYAFSGDLAAVHTAGGPGVYIRSGIGWVKQ
jgi:hypothetical protein